MNNEYFTLTREQKRQVDAVIAESRDTNGTAKRTVGGAEFYAYPHASGGTAWGIDDPINIKRGVMPR
jgi:hypothetical protein